MKKKIIIALAATLCIASFTGCQEKGETKDQTSKAETKTESRLDKIKASGKLVMGTSPDFAPSEFIDNSSGKTEYVGSDIELGKYIAQHLGVDLEVKAMEFSAIQQGVQSGTIDIGISGFAYKKERAEAMELTEKFNTEEDDSYQGLLVLKEKAGEYDTKESFAGKKIVAQNASLQQSLVEEQLPEDVKFQPVTTIPDGVMMLITGKADAVAVDGDNAENLIKNYPEVGMAGFKFDYGSEGNVAGIKKGETELLEAVNEAIKEVNEKGLYDKWTKEATALADSLGISMGE